MPISSFSAVIGGSSLAKGLMHESYLADYTSIVQPVLTANSRPKTHPGTATELSGIANAVRWSKAPVHRLIPNA